MRGAPRPRMLCLSTRPTRTERVCIVQGDVHERARHRWPAAGLRRQSRGSYLPLLPSHRLHLGQVSSAMLTLALAFSLKERGDSRKRTSGLESAAGCKCAAGPAGAGDCVCGFKFRVHKLNIGCCNEPVTSDCVFMTILSLCSARGCS